MINEAQQATRLPFPFANLDLDYGIKYMDFELKPNGYLKQECRWISGKFERKINFWCIRWISRGGILTLVKLVLQAILIYWHCLAHIPE